MEKLVQTMAKFICELTGTCPLDMFDYYKIECEKVCGIEKGRLPTDGFCQCWIDYFKEIRDKEK